MVDWRDVAQREGWRVGRRTVRVTLGVRVHTVEVREAGLDYQFRAAVPAVADKVGLRRLLESTAPPSWPSGTSTGGDRSP